MRHRLPEVILRHAAHVASETMFALNEYRACVPELQRLLQESQLECRHLVCRLKKAEESRDSLLDATRAMLDLIERE